MTGPVRPLSRQRVAAVAALACLAAAACQPPAPTPRGAPAAARALPEPQSGRWPFDFWVLALSWSPTHCGEDGMAERDAQQCAGPRRHAFVVHGLWPQFEQGYPRSCPTRMAAPDRQLGAAMLDIMPSRRLVAIQWERHGTCSGLAAADYFATIRAARQAVTIPDRFTGPQDWQQLSAGAVEAAFRAANPGLAADAIAVESRGPRLREVRVCLDRSLAFRSCPQVDDDGVAPNRQLRVPPVRGG